MNSNDDIQKILQELMFRLEDIEVEAQLHKLLYDGLRKDNENRVRMLNDDSYINITMNSD